MQVLIRKKISGNNLRTLVHKEFRHALRNRWFLLYAVIFTLLSLGLSYIGLVSGQIYGMSGFGRTTASLINLMMLIIPLMGLTLGAMSLSHEREQGSLMYLLAQPITPAELLLGKFLGLAGAMTAALFLGFGLSGLLLGLMGGTQNMGVFLALILFSLLLSLVSLSIGLAISSFIRKSGTAIGISIFLWLILVFIGDLGLLGTSMVLNLSTGQLLTLSLVNPVQVYKIAALMLLRGNLEVLGAAGTYAVRTFGDLMLPLSVMLLIMWTVIPLFISYGSFRRKGAI